MADEGQNEPDPAQNLPPGAVPLEELGIIPWKVDMGLRTLPDGQRVVRLMFKTTAGDLRILLQPQTAIDLGSDMVEAGEAARLHIGRPGGNGGIIPA